MNPNHSITPAKKILVTGGYGTLGSYIREAFHASTVILTGKDTLDVTNKTQVVVAIKKYNPDLLIHLAALTDVDFCEKNPKLAMDVNFGGTKNIVSVCSSYNIPLVYISTAAVFNGEHPPPGGYRETDIPSPSNFYAKTKLLSEEIIQNTLTHFLIVRVGWLIGGGKREKKFISYISNNIKNGDTVRVVHDVVGSIAYAKDLSAFIRARIIRSEFGLYHFGYKGVCSRFDIANVLREMLNKKAVIIPVAHDEFKKTFFAPRPQKEILQSIEIPFRKRWDTALKHYIATEFMA